MIDLRPDVPDDERLEGKRCPLCGGTDVRLKFPTSEAPIEYCLDCMLGDSMPRFPAIDMSLFESCQIQYRRKHGRDFFDQSEGKENE